LSALGFPAYEVSNFARAPELRSRHNRKYWDHTPYLGIGLGAHSFAWDARGARRWWNERKIRPWTAKVAAAQRPLAGEETLDIAALRLEALLLGLRTAEGIDLDRFRERYGLDLAAANEALLARLTAEDLAERAGSRLRLTPRGLAVADGLAARFTVA
ncbi:MAG TPA: coproporphyrinogen III oxidase family protein, partial [Thermoanaerobaculia bacterium]|nr:coproporphyrinogen III oxidase family protein [Thermoanaerobaculia bacterium]